MLLTFLAFGCGDTDGAVSNDEDVAVSDSDAKRLSPLEAFFADSGGRESTLIRWQILVQEDTAACMRAQGFEFSVSVPDPPESLTERSLLSDAEWASKHGFGMSTSLNERLATEAQDPNSAYFFELSDLEKEQYLTALSGQAIAEGRVSRPEDVPPLDEQGCSGFALEKNGGLAVTEGLNDFNQQYLDAVERVRSSPEMATSLDQWSTCMAAEGYSYRTPDGPQEYIAGRLVELGAELATALAGLPESDQDALMASGLDAANIPGFDPDALIGLQQEEIRLAVAANRCFEDSGKDVYDLLLGEVETNLIDQYSKELNAAKELLTE